MIARLFESSATFKKCTAEKVAFIALGAVDLLLTLTAVNLGLSELNPVIRFLLYIPVLLLLVKLLLPVFIAWLMPGKLLLPSIMLLALVIIWDIKELVFFMV